MEWIKKEPMAFALGLLVVGIAVRECFRVPVPIAAPVPQRLIIETSGGEAVAAADGTIIVKVDTPDHALEEKSAVPVAVLAVEPKPEVAVPEVVAAAAVAEKNPVVVPEPKAEVPDEKSVAEESTNTAGGRGEAAVKEKTTSEEMVPEEASALAESVGQRISPILQSLRKSGRLNWKLGELEDDVLILDWKQEKYILEVGYDLESYFPEIDRIWEEIGLRAKISMNSEIFYDMLSKLRNGEVVHPQLRQKFMFIMNRLKVPSLSSFYGVSEVGTSDHPLFSGRVRLVGLDMRRSDLFYMIAAFRLANENYAELLKLEAVVDDVMSYADLNTLCTKGNRVISAPGVDGNPVNVDTDGKIYLPRLYQEHFSSWYSGNEPAGFVSTREQPRDRDSLKVRREALDEKIQGIMEILGEDWAKFDFPSATIVSDDVFYRNRVLLEELESRSDNGELSAFREFMKRLSAAKTIDDAKTIAEEVLSVKDAAHLANYIISSSPSLYGKPYLGPDKDFRVEDLTQSLQAVYRGLDGEGIRSLFAAVPAVDLTKAVEMISRGELYAADGNNDEAIECFKEAAATTQLSDVRLKHFAEYCEKNGHADDAGKFLSKRASDAE